MLIIGVSYNLGKKFYGLIESRIKKKHAEENERFLSAGKNLHPVPVYRKKCQNSKESALLFKKRGGR
jgi:hypothetical protein